MVLRLCASLQSKGVKKRISMIVTQNGMSLKMECHSKCDVTQDGMSIIMEFHFNLNATYNGISLQMECH